VGKKKETVCKIPPGSYIPEGSKNSRRLQKFLKAPKKSSRQKLEPRGMQLEVKA